MSNSRRLLGAMGVLLITTIGGVAAQTAIPAVSPNQAIAQAENSSAGTRDQKLDSVKVGCGKKTLGSESGEIHRLPEATRRATESETAVAAQPGTLPRKMHVSEVLVGLCCSCLDCTGNHLGMSADTLVFIALRRTAKSPQQSLCGSNRFLAPSSWFSMVSA